MTDQVDDERWVLDAPEFPEGPQPSGQTTARQAEQIAWQRQAAMLLGKLLGLAAKRRLPPINWTVASCAHYG